MSYHCNKLKQVIVPDIFNHGQITTTHNPMHASRLLTNQPDSVRNPRLLHFNALDLIGCMHLSLGLSRSNVVETNSSKNHYRIKI